MKLSTKAIIIITGLLALVLLIIAPIILTLKLNLIRLDNEASSQIGDTIGGTTAPVIGLISILLLVWTLREQTIFNKEQRKLAFDEQFKSTFFTLLNTQRDISAKIRPVNRGQTFFTSSYLILDKIFNVLDSKIFITEDDYFNAQTELKNIDMCIEEGQYSESEVNEKYNENDEICRFYRFCCKYHITQEIFDKYNILRDDMPQKIYMAFDIFFKQNYRVGGYFRNLYYILKYIQRTENEDIETYHKGENEEHINEVKEKYNDYAQFIQAQMTFEELLLLFYDSFKFPKLQKLIIKYNLLDNLYVSMLIKPEHDCRPEIHLKTD